MRAPGVQASLPCTLRAGPKAGQCRCPLPRCTLSPHLQVQVQQAAVVQVCRHREGRAAGTGAAAGSSRGRAVQRAQVQQQAAAGLHRLGDSKVCDPAMPCTQIRAGCCICRSQASPLATLMATFHPRLCPARQGGMEPGRRSQGSGLQCERGATVARQQQPLLGGARRQQHTVTLKPRCQGREQHQHPPPHSQTGARR